MVVSTDLHPGSHLLGYRIERELGRGGMGVVYLAHHVVLDRMVALKLLAPELAEDEGFRDRFLRESRTAASLDHPAIVPIYDAGEVEGRLYIAMRHVEGADLGRVLDTDAPLAPDRTLALLDPIADALDAAHERGLVHRDVKPANILVGEGERPFLADFGLTKQVAELGRIEQSHFAASIHYVAPEQIEGASVGPAADVYSLGCVLFECLTGSPPFGGASVMATLWGHANDAPPSASERNPVLPRTIDAVLDRALAKDPGERYGTCRELLDAARHALGLAPRRSRRGARVLTAAALVILATAAVLAAVLLRDDAPAALPPVAYNTLVRIDPATDRIAAVTAVGAGRGPSAALAGAEGVAVGGGRVWVYNWDGRAVWAIDEDTNAVERTVSIEGSTPFGHINSIAADADGAWALSTRGGRGLLTHVRPGIEVARPFELDYDPLGVAVGHGSVWVAGKRIGSDQVVLRVDPESGAVRAVVPLRGAVLDPQNIVRDVQAIAVGADAVWAVIGRTLFRIDPQTARVSGRLTFGSGEPVALAADADAVWVSTLLPSGPALVAVDARTLRVTATTRAPAIDGAAPGAVAVQGDSVWWTGMGAGVVWRVDRPSGRIVSTVRLLPPVRSFSDAVPLNVAATADGAWVTVAATP